MLLHYGSERGVSRARIPIATRTWRRNCWKRRAGDAPADASARRTDTFGTARPTFHDSSFSVVAAWAVAFFLRRKRRARWNREITFDQQLHIRRFSCVKVECARAACCSVILKKNLCAICGSSSRERCGYQQQEEEVLAETQRVPVT